MKIRKLIESFLCITIFLHLIVQPIAAQDGLGWYCVRNKDHKQPRADANMQFIEKYNGYYIDHRHGDECEEKVVYLTFDAGYENGNVEKILDTLGKEQVPGAFFVLAMCIAIMNKIKAKHGMEPAQVPDYCSKDGSCDSCANTMCGGKAFAEEKKQA